MTSRQNSTEQKEIPEVIKDETRAPAQIKKYERGRFLGKVTYFKLKVSQRDMINQIKFGS